MSILHPRRVLIAFIALICMLTMQFAVAAYVCPGMANASNMMASMSNTEPAMMHCGGNMDMVQPGLCHAHTHDQSNKLSLDKPDFPDVAPFVPVGLVVVATITDDTTSSSSFSPSLQFLTRATAPPIAIRNCCFRI
jgi:hypothetical protein